MGFFDKLKNGLTKTKDAFFGQVNDVLKSFRRVDEDLLEELKTNANVETFLKVLG